MFDFPYDYDSAYDTPPASPRSVPRDEDLELREALRVSLDTTSLERYADDLHLELALKRSLDYPQPCVEGPLPKALRHYSFLITDIFIPLLVGTGSFQNVLSFLCITRESYITLQRNYEAIRKRLFQLRVLPLGMGYRLLWPTIEQSAVLGKRSQNLSFVVVADCDPLYWMTRDTVLYIAAREGTSPISYYHQLMAKDPLLPGVIYNEAALCLLKTTLEG